MKTARAEQARAPFTTTSLQPWAFCSCVWPLLGALCVVPKDKALRTPPLGARARWKHNQSVAFAVGASFHTTLMKPVPKGCVLCHCPAESGFALGQNPGLLSKGPLPASPRLGAGSHWVLPVG